MSEQVIKVLDKGFVRLEDRMGGDLSVVRAARVSYLSEPKAPEDDQKLIAFLLKHNHGTPFEHAVFQFHIKLPIFVARQWIRHRMSSYNETSFRYREAPEEFYIPLKWRAQEIKNKQGSVQSDDLPHAEMSEKLVAHGEASMQLYRELIRGGAAREMARMVLPTNLYTEWYWTVNARSLMHFIALRSDSHAQWETRQFSHALASIMRDTMPMTWKSFSGPLGEGFIEMQRALEQQQPVLVAP